MGKVWFLENAFHYCAFYTNVTYFSAFYTLLNTHTPGMTSMVGSPNHSVWRAVKHIVHWTWFMGTSVMTCRNQTGDLAVDHQPNSLTYKPQLYFLFCIIITI